MIDDSPRAAAVWRNFELKLLHGFAQQLDRMAAHCPEATNEVYRLKYNLAEAIKRIEEVNAKLPHAGSHVRRPKMRRINVT